MPLQKFHNAYPKVNTTGGEKKSKRNQTDLNGFWFSDLLPHEYRALKNAAKKGKEVAEC